jgi:transposase
LVITAVVVEGRPVAEVAADLTAVVVEGRPVAEVAADYGVARSWIYELLSRYRTEGETAFEPRSRRPHTQPAAIPAATVELIIQLRRELTAQGLDAGPHTIAWHWPSSISFRYRRPPSGAP